MESFVVGFIVGVLLNLAVSELRFRLQARKQEQSLVALDKWIEDEANTPTPGYPKKGVR